MNFNSTSSLVQASSIDASVWDGQTDGRLYLDNDGSALDVSQLDWFANGSSYYIRSAKGLAHFANLVNGSGGASQDFAGCSIYLETNIDWSGRTWIPIGNTTSFSGIFNGQGHYVYNLNMTNSDTSVGFFNNLPSYATVENLHLRNISVSATSAVSNVGGIAGTSAGVISYSSVTGAINRTYSSDANIGGIVGSTTGGVVQNTYSEVNFSLAGSANLMVGGIIGQANATSSTTLENSYFSGNMTGRANNVYAGGLVGAVYGGSSLNIQNSYNAGSISLSSISGVGYVGGIVGYVHHNNVGSTTGRSEVNLSFVFNMGEISNISSTTAYVSTLIGYVNGDAVLNNVFDVLTASETSLPLFTAGQYVTGGQSYAGEIDCSNTYYDSSRIATAVPSVADSQDWTVGNLAVLAKTYEFYQNTSYFSEGWDFDAVWSISTGVNDGFPYIEISANGNNDDDTTNSSLWQGEGTQESPYIIKTAGDLVTVSSFFSGSSGTAVEGISYHFSLQADIDLAGRTWQPIGLGVVFRGVFDGNNHTISGLTCSLQEPFSYAGLFARTDGAVIKNLILEDFRFVGNATSNMGALIAYANDTYVINVADFSGSGVDTIGAGNVNIFYGQNNADGSINENTITSGARVSNSGYDVTIFGNDGYFYDANREIYGGRYHLLLTSQMRVVTQTIDATYGKNLPTAIENMGSEDVVLKRGSRLEGFVYSNTQNHLLQATFNPYNAVMGLEAIWEDNAAGASFRIYFNKYEVLNFNTQADEDAPYVGTVAYYFDGRTYQPVQNADGTLATYQLDDDGSLYIEIETVYSAYLSEYEYVFEDFYYPVSDGYISLRGDDFSVSADGHRTIDSDGRINEETPYQAFEVSNSGLIDDNFSTDDFTVTWVGNSSSDYDITINFQKNDEKFEIADAVKTVALVLSEDGTKTYPPAVWNGDSVTMSYDTTYSDSLLSFATVGISLNYGFTYNVDSMILEPELIRDTNFGTLTRSIGNGILRLFTSKNLNELSTLTDAELARLTQFYNLIGDYTITIELERELYTDSLEVGENITFGLSPAQTISVTQDDDGNFSSTAYILTGDRGYVDIVELFEEVDWSALANEESIYMGFDLYNESVIFSSGIYDVQQLLFTQTQQVVFRYNNGSGFDYYMIDLSTDSLDDGSETAFEVVTLYSISETQIVNEEIVSYRRVAGEPENDSVSYRSGNSFVFIASTEDDSLTFSDATGLSGFYDSQDIEGSLFENGTSSVRANSLRDVEGPAYTKYLFTFNQIVKVSDNNEKLTAIAEYVDAVLDYKFVYRGLNGEEEAPINFNENAPTVTDNSTKRITPNVPGEIQIELLNSSAYRFFIDSAGTDGINLYSGTADEIFNIQVEVQYSNSSYNDPEGYENGLNGNNTASGIFSVDGYSMLAQEDGLRINLNYTNDLRPAHYTITLICTDQTYRINYGTKFIELDGSSLYSSSTRYQNFNFTDEEGEDANLMSLSVNDEEYQGTYNNFQGGNAVETQFSSASDSSGTEIASASFLGSKSVRYTDELDVSVQEKNGYSFFGFYIRGVDYQILVRGTEDYVSNMTLGELYNYGISGASDQSRQQANPYFAAEGIEWQLTIFAVYTRSQFNLQFNGSYIIDNINGSDEEFVSTYNSTYLNFIMSTDGELNNVQNNAYVYDYSVNENASNFNMELSGSYADGYYFVGYRIVSSEWNGANPPANSVIEEQSTSAQFDTIEVDMSSWLQSDMASGRVVGDGSNETYYIVPIIRQKTMTITFHSGTGGENYTDGKDGHVFDVAGSETTTNTYTYSTMLYFNRGIESGQTNTLNVDAIVPELQSETISNLFASRTGYHKASVQYWRWQNESGSQSGLIGFDTLELTNANMFSGSVTIADVHFYVYWEANSYTIVYVSNDPNAVGVVPVQNVLYDQQFNISYNNFTLSGHSFVNWNTTADGMGISYEEGRQVSNLCTGAEGDSTISLYALWTENDYGIVIDANGGLIDEIQEQTTEQLTYNSTFENLLAKLQSRVTRNGFTLEGFYAVSENTTFRIEDDTIFNINLFTFSLPVQPNEVALTIYANWIFDGEISLAIVNNSPLANLTYTGLDQTVNVAQYFTDGNFVASGLSVTSSGTLTFVATEAQSVDVDFEIAQNSDEVVLTGEDSFSVRNADTHSILFTLTVADGAGEEGFVLNLGTLYRVSFILYVTVDKAELQLTLDENDWTAIRLENARKLIQPFVNDSLDEQLESADSLSALATIAKSMDTTDPFQSNGEDATDLEIYEFLMVKFYLLMHTNNSEESLTYRGWQFADFLEYRADNESNVESILQNVNFFAFYDHLQSSSSVDVEEYRTIFSVVDGVNNEHDTISRVEIVSSLGLAINARNTYQLRIYLANSGNVLNNYNVLTDAENPYIVFGTAYIMPEILVLDNFSHANMVYYSSSYSSREVEWIGNESGETTSILNLGDFFQVSTIGTNPLYVRAQIQTSNGGSAEYDTQFSFNNQENFLYLTNTGVRALIGGYYIDYSSSFKLVLDEEFVFTILNIQDVASISISANYFSIVNGTGYYNSLSESLASGLLSVSAVFYQLEEQGEVLISDIAEIQDVVENYGGVFESDGTIVYQIYTTDANTVTLLINKVVTGLEFVANATSVDSPSYDDENGFISLYKWVEGEFNEYGVDGTMVSGDTLSISFDWGNGVAQNPVSENSFALSTTIEENGEELTTVEYEAVYTDLVRVEFQYTYPQSYTPTGSIETAYFKLGQTTQDDMTKPYEPGFGECVLTPTFGAETLEELFNGAGGTYVGGVISSNKYATVVLDVKWTISPEIDAVQTMFDYVTAVSSFERLRVIDVVSLINTNSELYDYTYQWFKQDDNGEYEFEDESGIPRRFTLVSESEELVLAEGGSINESGTYRLSITQTMKPEFEISLAEVGQTSASADFEFSMTFMQNLLQSVQILQENELTYDNIDHISQMSVEFSYLYYDNELQGYNSSPITQTIGYVTTGDITFAVSLNDELVSQMRNVGEYDVEITIQNGKFDTSSTILGEGLSWDEQGRLHFTYTISHYSLDISSLVFDFTKVFNGLETELNQQVSVNNEVVTIALQRDTGEDVGEYDVFLASSQNNNYAFIFNGQTLYQNSLTQEGLSTPVGTFTITQSGMLRFSYEISELDPEVLQVDFSLEGYSISLTQDLHLVISNGDSVVHEFTLVLYDVARGMNVADDTILQIIRDNISSVTPKFYLAQQFDTVQTSGVYAYQFVLGDFSKLYSSIEMAPTFQFEILPNTIDVSGMTFSKVFDGTTTDSVALDAQQGLNIEVTYSSAHAGSHDVTLTLRASDSSVNLNNFRLSATTAKGTITPRDATLQVEMTEEEYVYGIVSNSNLANLISKVSITSGQQDFSNFLEQGYYSISYSLPQGTQSNNRGFVYAGRYALQISATFNDFNITQTTAPSFDVTPRVVEAQIPTNYITITTDDTVQASYSSTQIITETGDELTLSLGVLGSDGQPVTDGTLSPGQYNLTLLQTEYLTNNSVVVTLAENNLGFNVVQAENTLYVGFASEDIGNLTQTYNANAYTFSVDITRNVLVISNGESQVEVDLEFSVPEGESLRDFTFETATISSVGGSGIVNAGTYKLAISATVTGNTYTNIVFASEQIFTILQAEVDVQELAIEKEYDGETILTLETYADLSPIGFGEDDVSVLVRFDNANHGTGKSVNLFLQGTNSSNYILSSETATGTITQSTAHFSFMRTTFTYGEITENNNFLSTMISVTDEEGNQISSSQFQFSIEIAGATYSETGYLQVNDGGYVVTVSNALSSNYAIAQLEQNITISPYQISLTFTHDGEITAEYGSVTGTDVFYTLPSSDLFESVQLRLTRDSSSPEIGFYHITAGESLNPNYVLTSVRDTSTRGAFEIIRPSSRLYVLFAEDVPGTDNEAVIPEISFEYDGNLYDGVRIEQSGNGWQLVIYNTANTNIQRAYALAFYTYDNGNYVLYDGTVEGLSAEISFLHADTVRNIGAYQIYASGATSATHEIRIGKDNTSFAFVVNIQQKDLYFKDNIIIGEETVLANGTIYQPFKNADAIYQFEDASTFLNGIVEGETFALNLTFRTAGGDVAFYVSRNNSVEAVLQGEGAENYLIHIATSSAPTETLVGEVARANFWIVMDDQTLAYGQYEESGFVWNYDFEIENFNLEDYLTSSGRRFDVSISLVAPVYSSTNHLRVGSYTLTRSIITDDFAIAGFIVNGSDNADLTAVVTVAPKQLTISQISEDLQEIFTKRYDGTDIANIFDDEGNLKFEVNGILSDGALQDDVEVVGANFSTALPNQPIEVTFALQGNDAQNYEVTPWATGIIEAITINLEFNYDKDSIPSNVSLSGQQLISVLTYPFETSASSILTSNSASTDTSSTRNFPSSLFREGFNFVGWTMDFEATTQAQKNLLDLLISTYGMRASIDGDSYSVEVGNNSNTVRFLSGLISDTTDVFGQYYFASHADDGITVVFNPVWSVYQNELTISIADETGATSETNLGQVEVVVGDEVTETISSSDSVSFDYGTQVVLRVTPNAHCFFYAFYVDGAYFNGSGNMQIGQSGEATTLTILSLTDDFEIQVRIVVQQVNVIIDLSTEPEATIESDNFTSIGNNQHQWSTDYFTLSGQTMADLPNILLDGYNLSGFTIGEDEVLLEDFADTSLATFLPIDSTERTISITLVPQFEPADVSVTLDFGYDNLTSQITVKFASTYDTASGWVETPLRTGYTFAGWFAGQTQVLGTTTVSNSQPHTLVASWNINRHSITLISPNAQISSSSVEFAHQGDEYVATDVDYGTTITFSLQANSGWEISSTWAPEFNAQVSADGRTATVTFVVPDHDTTYTIPVLASVNTIQISGQNIDSVQVFDVTDGGSTEIEISNSSFEVMTGRTIQFVVSANAGFVMTEEVVHDAGNDVIVDTEIDGSGNLIVTVSEINQDASFEFVATERDNTITIGFDDASVVQAVVANGTTYTTEALPPLSAKTNSNLIFYVRFVDGYEFDDETFECADFTVTPEYVSDGVYAGYYSFTVSDILSDGTIEVTSRLTTVTLSVEVRSFDENHDEAEIAGNRAFVNGTDTVEVQYGTQVTLSYEISRQYTFAGWSLDGSNVLSRENDYIYTATSDQTIYALFSYSASLYSISLSTWAQNEVYTENGQTEAQMQEIDGGTFFNASTGEEISSFEIYYGAEITVRFAVPEGYRYYGFGYFLDDEFVYLGREDRTESVVDVRISTFSFGEVDVSELCFVVASYSVIVDFETKIRVGDNILEDESVGSIRLSDADGNVAENGYVVGTGVHYATTPTTLQEMQVVAYSGETIYVRIETAQKGYSFDRIVPNRDDIIVMNAYSGDDFVVYSISGLVGGMQGVVIEVQFAPNTNYVDVNFTQNGEIVEGGAFVATSSIEELPIRVSGREYDAITVSAYTDGEFEVVAYIRAGFDGSNLLIEDLHGIVVEGSVTYEALSIEQTGYSGKITFRVAGYSGRNAINIELMSETYTVHIKDGETILATVHNVAFNSALNLSENNSQNIEIHDNRLIYSAGRLNLVLTREGYDFMGYFTYPNGAGVQYINSSGEIVRNWLESGYVYNSIANIYVLAENAQFGENGEIEISIYLYQSYQKTRINFTFVPGTISNITAQDMVSGVDYTNSWFYPSGPYYIEVAFNTDITITAPQIDGFRFYKFVISQRRADGTWLTDVTSFSESVPWSTNASDNIVECQIQVYYYAQVDVRVMGGDATYTITQDGANDSQARVLLSQGYVDPTRVFTIEATAGEGYTFSHWFNNTTGQTLSGSTQIFSASRRLTLLLYVEGNEVTLDFSRYDSTFGQIVSLQAVSALGEEESFLLGSYVGDEFHQTITQVEVKVGDEITFAVSVDFGFAVTWNRDDIVYAGTRGEYDLFTMTIAPELPDSVVEIIPNFTDRVYSVFISQRFKDECIKDGATDGNDVSLAGFVTHNNQPVSFFTSERGNDIRIVVVTNPRYAVSRVVITNNGATFDNMDEIFVDGTILLTADFLTANNIMGTIGVEVVYARQLWENENLDGLFFEGTGTEDDPYRINNIDDLTLMMQLCNSGQFNSNGVMYSECSYILTTDLNLGEKFWTPIGTVEVPFNGEFNFNGHTVSGIYTEVFYEVVNYNGLFGVLGANANIHTIEASIWYVYLIVALLLLLLLILLVLYLVNRRRKKVREELAKH